MHNIHINFNIKVTPATSQPSSWAETKHHVCIVLFDDYEWKSLSIHSMNNVWEWNAFSLSLSICILWRKEIFGKNFELNSNIVLSSLWGRMRSTCEWSAFGMQCNFQHWWLLGALRSSNAKNQGVHKSSHRSVQGPGTPSSYVLYLFSCNNSNIPKITWWKYIRFGILLLQTRGSTRLLLLLFWFILFSQWVPTFT